MRVKKLKRAVDQNTANSKSEDDDHVLHWTQGHPRGTKFQCFARTGDGSVAVGCFDGKIRLYSKSSMKQAKTVFPGLGYPITHIDVTHDGKWILATTDTYLILMSTLFTDHSKDGKIRKTGFTGRMGSKFPPPTLLKLTPADMNRAGVETKFQDGQFSWVTESRKEERHLVATVGEFSVLWNFQLVKNSGHECYRTQQGLKSCYCYKLVPKDELIIESRFMQEHDKLDKSPDVPMDVVATPPIKVTSINMLCKKEGDDTPS